MERHFSSHKTTILPSLALLKLAIILCQAFSEVGACLEREREALNTLRKGLQDPFGLLSSWDHGEDCCKWKGVSCDNNTGYVIKLDLHGDLAFSNAGLSGRIDPALLELKYLQFLDLNDNDFSGTSIPGFLGSMKELRHLDLSWGGFGGRIPHQLGNLSNLVSLQFSSNSDLSVENLWWLTNMSSLEYLDMNDVNLSLASQHWVHAIMNGCPSLVELHLGSCDLSYIPSSLSYVNFTSLSVLDILGNYFDSTIPNWITNISSLISLYLVDNKFRGRIPYQMSELPNLEQLSMGGLDDNLAPDWSEFSEGGWNKLKNLLLWLSHGPIPESIGNITSLVSLSLTASGGSIPDALGRLKKLAYLDISNCSGPIPAALGGLSSLKTLSLSSNQLNGTIPETLGGLSSLEILYLSNNQLNGKIPETLGGLSSLELLNLDRNRLSGTIPETLGGLSSLKELNLQRNQLSGNVSETHFENLRELKLLALDGNPLVMDLQPDWIPPFQLEELNLRSIRVGPRFPLWLRTQKMIHVLDISNASISDIVPTGFWDIGTTIKFLNLSCNMLSGQLPNILEMKNLSHLDLSWNLLTGPIPCLSSPFLSVLDLSNNRFSGPMPTNFSYPSIFFSSSGNQISGSIPTSICQMSGITFLDLSKNNLSGTIPATIGNCTGLVALDLSGNYLSGSIPMSMASLVRLKTLHLSSNDLSGKLPFSLKNCSSLVALDLGDNKFSGKIPSWIGKSFTRLRILRLRSNLFTEGIPPQLFLLTSLQVFDVACNWLFGPIPRAFEDLKEMKNGTHDVLEYDGYFDPEYSIEGLSYGENLIVSTKGQSLIYTKTISLLTCIDLSNNNFSGEIPDALTTLSGLNVLNLSGNHLIGNIPKNIGRLVMLESLDLSRNELSGIIPQSISSLYFLSSLNLSHNNLSGRIPSGKQLQALPDPTIYSGNAGLCGFPLSACGGNNTYEGRDEKDHPGDGDHQDEKDSLMFWFYLGIGPGFVVGFWTICGILILNKAWRIAYFHIVDNMAVKFYIFVNRWTARLKSLKQKMADEE